MGWRGTTRRPACVAIAVLAAGACGSTEPGSEASGEVALTIRGGAAQPTMLGADSVSLLLEPLDAGAISITAGAAWPPALDSIRLTATVPMTADVASLLFTVRLLAAEVVVFETASRGSIRRGTLTEIPPIEPAGWLNVGGQVGPTPRHAAGLTAAPALGGVVLYGGLTVTGNDGSTWIFDGTTWSAPQFTDPTPAGRHGHALAFDTVRSEVVMFGGRVINIAPVSDTWVLGAAGWVRAQPATSPAARTAHAMAYDPDRRRVVLFGGLDLQGSLGDTWVWDGVTWQQMSGGGPPGRSGHSMVWSPVRRALILFGGSTTEGVQSDVWEWDGGRWNLRDVQGDIPPRREHAAAWDASRGRMVVVGGFAISGVPLEDVWELVDNRWMPVSHAARPTPRFGPAMAQDVSRGVLLFGGRDSDTFFSDTWRYH